MVSRRSQSAAGSTIHREAGRFYAATASTSTLRRTARIAGRADNQQSKRESTPAVPVCPGSSRPCSSPARPTPDPDTQSLRGQPPAATLPQLQRQLDAFRGYYNTMRQHRALHRRTRAQAYARPKATPTGAIIDAAHWRTRQDKIDRSGVVTLRHSRRLHHIGLLDPHKDYQRQGHDVNDVAGHL